MALVATEQDILRVIAELKQAATSQIQQRTGLTPGYTDYLCKYLVRGGYLKSVGQSRYTLAPRGRKMLVAHDSEVSLDEASIKKLAGQVAKEVSWAIKKKGRTREIVREIVKERIISPGEERKKIQIKTDYVFPVTDETIGLETNIEKVGAKLEEETGASVDASVQLLKNISAKGGSASGGKKEKLINKQ